MRKILLGLVLLCSLSAVARADEASKREKVAKLVEMMHMDRIMEQMTTAMKAQMEAQFKATPGVEDMTPEQKKITDRFMNKAMDMASSYMSWKAMQPMFLDLYAKDFTDEEVDGMLAFYSSPVGQSVLTKMPQMMSEVMPLVQDKVKDLQPKMTELIQDYVAEMAKTKETKPGAATTKPTKKS